VAHMDEAGQVDELVADVAGFIDRRSLLRCGQGVVVGVSGGPDSVALLAVLRDLAAQAGRGYRLTAAHLDHQLRPAAAEEARFVARLAGAWGIACVVEARDVRAAAGAGGQGIEAAARGLRYEFLAAVAARCGADAVAVGHHADDNVETILQRIVRGTHLRGLAGIPASRVLGHGGPLLVRPMLQVRRERIEAFCRRRGLEWRTDESNADPAYRRNFIRHELLPLLRARLNERTEEALLRLAAAAAAAEQHLEQEGRQALARAIRHRTDRRIVLAASALTVEDEIVRTYALRAALEDLHAPLGDVTGDLLAELADLPLSPAPAAVTLPGRFLARREGGELVIEATPPPGDLAPGEYTRGFDLQCPGRTTLPDGRCVVASVAAFSGPAFVAHCISHAPGAELMDADSIHGRLVCRPRRDGDQFVPLGSPGTQTVSDFLTNARLPQRQREQVLCLCDEQGIIYLAPLRIADRVRVTDQTRSVLRVEISPG
jgi:tRNA(Ile)-lysidine synthase